MPKMRTFPPTSLKTAKAIPLPKVFTERNRMIILIQLTPKLKLEMEFDRKEAFDLLRAIADVPHTMEILK